MCYWQVVILEITDKIIITTVLFMNTLVNRSRVTPPFSNGRQWQYKGQLSFLRCLHQNLQQQKKFIQEQMDSERFLVSIGVCAAFHSRRASRNIQGLDEPGHDSSCDYQQLFLGSPSTFRHPPPPKPKVHFLTTYHESAIYRHLYIYI